MLLSRAQVTLTPLIVGIELTSSVGVEWSARAALTGLALTVAIFTLALTTAFALLIHFILEHLKVNLSRETALEVFKHLTTGDTATFRQLVSADVPVDGEVSGDIPELEFLRLLWCRLLRLHNASKTIGQAASEMLEYNVTKLMNENALTLTIR